jgi:hypothetical protein
MPPTTRLSYRLFYFLIFVDPVFTAFLNYFESIARAYG